MTHENIRNIVRRTETQRRLTSGRVKIDAPGSNVFKQERARGEGRGSGNRPRFIRGYQQAISRLAEWFVKAIYKLVCKQAAVPVCSRLRVRPSTRVRFIDAN